MTTTTPRIKFVCSRCGSDHVRCHALVDWDIAKQEWVLAVAYDGFYCLDCGADAVKQDD